MEEVEEEMAKEVLEEAAAHMKMGLKSHISTIYLKIQSGIHSQTRQGKKHRTRYALISYRIQIDIPPALSVQKKIIEKKLIPQIITGVQNATCREYLLEGGLIHFPTNGSSKQVSYENRISSSAIRNEP